ncbi:MAG: hypothetical protein GY711_05280 [bacterium]|nr:hypothetical protein [bacterium]
MRALPLLTAIALVSTVAQAQVASTPPFAGGHVESFEPPLEATAVACTSVPAFQNTAELCTPFASSLSVVPSGPVEGGTLFPRTGANLLSVFDGFVSGTAEITFEVPARRFGGWFAVESTQQALWIELFDTADNLLGFEQLDVSATGAWRWNGWELTGTPAARVRFSPNVNGLFFFEDLQLDADGAPGLVYCRADANSSGANARIFTTGTASVAANDLVLHAAYVPLAEAGIYIYGPNAVQQPVAVGFLCVGAPARLPIELAQGHRLSHALDLSAPPSPAYQITPGSTWFFQAWFRDTVAGPPSFNWSDGLAVTFVP